MAQAPFMGEGLAMAEDLAIAVVDGLDAVDPEAWDALFPGDPEGWRYLRAVEDAGIEGFELFYVLVRRGGRLVAAAPGFLTEYRLDTTVQGPIRRLTSALYAVAPGLLTLKLASLGSPVTETASLGLRPDTPDHPSLCGALYRGLEQHARRKGVRLLAVKDIPGAATDARIAARRSKLNPMSSLPTAVLRLEGLASEDDYWASLSHATRKDLRRKLKKSRATVERVRDVAPHAQTIDRLYTATRDRAEMQFEDLNWRYFQAVVDRLGDAAALFLYTVDGEAIAFNLLVGRDGVWVDKYFCADARGPDHNLYFVSWIHNVRFVLGERGRRLVAGQAAYDAKLRLGCGLEPTTIFFRHTLPPVNAVLALASRFVGVEETDPTLKKRKKSHRGRQPGHWTAEIGT